MIFWFLKYCFKFTSVIRQWLLFSWNMMKFYFFLNTFCIDNRSVITTVLMAIKATVYQSVIKRTDFLYILKWLSQTGLIPQLPRREGKTALLFSLSAFLLLSDNPKWVPDAGGKFPKGSWPGCNLAAASWPQCCPGSQSDHSPTSACMAGGLRHSLYLSASHCAHQCLSVCVFSSLLRCWFFVSVKLEWLLYRIER